MHENIKKFSLEGEMFDDNIVEAKERLIFALETQMRDNGVVPILDMEPQFTLRYLEDKEKYAFELSVYGTKVGVDAAWVTSGVMNGKMVTRHTARTK